MQSLKLCNIRKAYYVWWRNLDMIRPQSTEPNGSDYTKNLYYGRRPCVSIIVR